MNRICLIGRLVRDPDLRYSQSGIGIVNFTLAVDRNFKNAQGEREADFINCVAYKQLAELIANYLSKGKKAGVDGRLQIRSYEKDGQKRTVAEVIVDNADFLSPKGEPAVSVEGGESPLGKVVSDEAIPSFFLGGK